MKFRSILAAFLFIILATFVAVFVFIQTDSFGKLVSRIVSDISKKTFNTAIKVESLNFSYFPPGLELNKVNLEKQMAKDEKFSGEFGKVAIYFSLLEMEEKDFNFTEVKISDSVINYSFPKKNEELKEIDKEIINKIFNNSQNLPIDMDSIVLENSIINLNYEVLEAKRIKIYKKDNSFIGRFHVSNLRPEENSELVIDEIWGDLEIFRNKIDIYRLKINHDVQSVLVRGQIKNYRKLMSSEGKLSGEVNVHLENLKQEIPLPDLIKINSGDARVGFTFEFKDNQVFADVDLSMKDLNSTILNANDVKAFISLDKDEVNLKKLKIVNGNEKAILQEAVSIYRKNNKKIFPEEMNILFENFSLTNGLRVLGPELQVLKGELSGYLTFEYDKKNLFFTPKDKFVVRNLGLTTGNSGNEFNIIKIKKAILDGSQFSFVNNEFRMQSSLTLNNSKIDVKGFVGRDSVQFNVSDSKIDLLDLGNISGLDLKGKGTFDLEVSGPLKHTLIKIKGKSEGFEVLGYSLDKANKDITIDLAESVVIINKFDSKVGKTNLSGNGTVNYDNQEIALGISTNDTNFEELSQILRPVFNGLTFLPEDLEFNASVDVDIFGKYNLENLKIRSGIEFSELIAFGESVNSGKFDISLNNKILYFKNLDAFKDTGNINGDFIFNLKKDEFKINYFWENIELASLNSAKKMGLNLRSLISGKISGGGSVDNYKLNVESNAFNTRSENYKLDDSKTIFNITPKRVFGEANLLGKILETKFDIALNQGNASDLSLRLKTQKIKPLLVALLGTHLESENVTGKIDFEGEINFKNEFKDLNLTATLNHFNFNHPQFNFNYSSITPQFKVRNGAIQKWDLNVKQKDVSIFTRANGNLGDNSFFDHQINFNSTILDILSFPILSAEGLIESSLKIRNNKNLYDFSMSSKSEKLNLSIDQLPIQINDLTYDIELENKRLTINKMNTALDSGTLAIKGDVYFDNEQPDVNLKFILENAEIPLVGKSVANLSGEGIVVGNNFPYSVGGEIIINKAQIINELNEFNSKSAGFSQVRFLPKNQESSIGKILNLNLGIKAENPVRITNSLMDVALIGEVRLSGPPIRPRGEGRLSTPPNSSRIFFKNNEYQIVSADINFNPKKEITNPDFDIQALTIISNYKIFPKAYGDLERFNFDLLSEPALPRNSILSLIAFGYTEDIQGSLYARDQRSLTQVGVGSFVFDRFKISDILNKQFGLQVNLGTVIEQSSTDSLLSGRSQYSSSAQGTGALGRTRSATKIELRKRLDEELTLSVSSTMGGSIGQRQSMNLNYGLSKNIQVEGVYELRTNEEGEADIIYNSIGGDIKFRRTFK